VIFKPLTLWYFLIAAIANYTLMSELADEMTLIAPLFIS
jgi:hypothetical protein